MSLKKYQNINLKKAREQGFTIVELLIVIIVIAILAALVISAYSGIQAQARESAAKQKAKEAEKALVAYYNEWTKWPDSLGDLRSGNSINIDLVGQVNTINDMLEGNAFKDKPIVFMCPGAGTPKTGAVVSYYLAEDDEDGEPQAGPLTYLGEIDEGNAHTCLTL